MEIRHIFDKGSGRMNEDALFLGKHRFGVFDGATSLNDNNYVDKEGKTGGYIAAQIAKKMFENSQTSLADTARVVNEALKDAMVQNGIALDQKESLWCAAAVVIELHDNDFEWVQIGDSLVLLVYEDGSPEMLIKDYDHDKTVLMEWKRLAEQKVPDIRACLQHQIKVNRQAVNIRYGMLNGEAAAIHFFNLGSHSLKNVHHILLFTDGLLIPKEDPRTEDDFRLITKLFLAGGLENIQHYVRDLETSDPKCWRYPRYKQFDDIAAISISFIDSCS